MKLNFDQISTCALIGRSIGKPSVYRSVLESFGKNKLPNERTAVFNGSPAFYRDLSVEKNISVRRIVLDQPRNEWIKELCDAAGLTKRITGRKFRKDMTCEKQIYGVISTLFNKPELVLMNEPLVGLNADTRLKFAAILNLCKRENIKVAFSAALTDAVKLETVEQFMLVGSDGEPVVVTKQQLEQRRQDMKGDPSYEEVFKSFIKEGE
ncbi:MAG: hypothetical protein GX111_11715 [Clostridiales bacterium]|nr:hypothetical protein [Clostridiales bacterium]